MAVYFRRVPRTSRGGLFGRSRMPRYEVWQDHDEPMELTFGQLDGLLQGGRFPADFWANVQSADKAFAEGDYDSWIESGSGRRFHAPPPE